MGGYWVEKRKGVQEPKLVKTGSRHYPSELLPRTASQLLLSRKRHTDPLAIVTSDSTSQSSQIMNRRNKISLSPGGGGGQSDQRRSRSVPDSLLGDQGVYRRSDEWVEDD